METEGKKLLYVDDSPVTRMAYAGVLKMLFEPQGIEVVTAESAQDGLEKLSLAPDSYIGVISDHDMPHTLGLDFVKDLVKCGEDTARKRFYAVVTGNEDKTLDEIAAAHGIPLFRRSNPTPIQAVRQIFAAYQAHQMELNPSYS